MLDISLDSSPPGRTPTQGFPEVSRSLGVESRLLAAVDSLSHAKKRILTLESRCSQLNDENLRLANELQRAMEEKDTMYSQLMSSTRTEAESIESAKTVQRELDNLRRAEVSWAGKEQQLAEHQRRLDFSNEQKARLEELLRQSADEKTMLYDELRALKEELRAAKDRDSTLNNRDGQHHQEVSRRIQALEHELQVARSDSEQAVLKSQTEAEELRREIERLRPEEHSCDEMVSSSHDSARMVCGVTPVLNLVSVESDDLTVRFNTERVRANKAQARITTLDAQLRAVEFCALSDFELLVDNVFAPAIMCDTDGCITHWNRYAERTSGLVRSEVVGQQVEQLVVQENRAEVRSMVSNTLRSEDVAHTSLRIISKLGRSLHWELSSTRRLDCHGNTQGCVLIGTDSSHIDTIVDQRNTARTAQREADASMQQLKLQLDEALNDLQNARAARHEAELHAAELQSDLDEARDVAAKTRTAYNDAEHTSRHKAELEAERLQSAVSEALEDAAKARAARHEADARMRQLQSALNDEMEDSQKARTARQEAESRAQQLQSDLNYALQDAQRTVAAWYGDELRAQELQSALNDSVDDAIKARAAQRHAEMVSKELQVALDNAHRCRAHSEVDAIAELMPSSGANDVLAGGVNGESPPSSTAKSAARVEFMDVEADRAGGTAGSSARPYYTDDNIDHAVSHAADELGLCEHVRKVSKNVFEVGDKRVSVRCADGKVMVRVGGGYMKLCVFWGEVVHVMARLCSTTAVAIQEIGHFRKRNPPKP